MAAYRADFSGGGSGGTGNRTVTVTPAVGDLCVVFVVVSENTNASPTVTDNNSDASTYTLITTALKATSVDIVSVFVRDKLFSNTTSTIITANTGSNTSGELTAVHLTGMSKTGITAVRQFAKQENQAAGGTPAPAFSSAALTGNMTLGAVGNDTNVAGLTTPAGWTEQADVGQNTPAVGLETVTRDSGFTGTTITWGSTSASAFASIILELDNNPVIEEEDTFWGTFNRNVVMGIAATVLTSGMVTSALAQQVTMGDPSASDIFVADAPIIEEEYWQNPVPPIADRLYQQLPYLYDAQDDPAATLLNAPGTTEDYWQVVWANTPYKRLKLDIEDEVVPQPPDAGPEEDYWGTPGSTTPPDLYPEVLFLPFPLGSYGSDATTGAPPNVEEDYVQVVQDIHAYHGLPYVLGGNEDTRFPLVQVLVEDLDWNILTGLPRPQEASLYQRLPYLPDPDELTAEWQEAVNPEEDYWINGPFPVAASLYQRLPYLPEPEEIPAGLFGCLVEDFWVNPVEPVPPIQRIQFPVIPDKEEPEFAFLVTDEDYWISPVPLLIQQAKNGPLLFHDQGDIAFFVSIAEEDYWERLVFPQQAKMYQVLPLLPDQTSDAYVFFGEAEVGCVSVEPLVTMDITVEPLVAMNIRMLKARWE